MKNNQFIYEADLGINNNLILSEFNDLKTRLKLHNYKQISVTGLNEDSGLECSTGKGADLEYPELCYYKVLKEFQGTYIEECVNQFSDYYRWRFLILPPNSCYSIHKDFNLLKMHPEIPLSVNVRLHIPILTNPNSYMYFYDTLEDDVYDSSKSTITNGKHDVYFYNMQVGKVYNTCTSYLHSAINHSNQTRIHLVGVKEVTLHHLDEIPGALKL